MIVMMSQIRGEVVVDGRVVEWGTVYTLLLGCRVEILITAERDEQGSI